MNEQGRPLERPRQHQLSVGSVALRPARVTGLQAAQVGLGRQLEVWREHFSAREYATLLDLHRRWLEHELDRNERALARWTA
jgi:hypothetical protein